MSVGRKLQTAELGDESSPEVPDTLTELQTKRAATKKRPSHCERFVRSDFFVIPARLRACLRCRFGRLAETCLRTGVLRHAGAPHFGVQARR